MLKVKGDLTVLQNVKKPFINSCTPNFTSIIESPMSFKTVKVCFENTCIVDLKCAFQCHSKALNAFKCDNFW